MRRPSPVDLMLIATIVIWAFNITVTKYVLTHGFQPLAYGAIRYAAAAILAVAVAVVLEGTLRVSGRNNLALVGTASAVLLVNQVSFVYALKLGSATTVALILGMTPIFAAIISSLVGLEQLTGRFWVATLVGFVGVALVALGSLVWAGLAFAIVGPLFLTNILWFKSIGVVGPSRATLFANAQPFVAAIFAALILSEHLHWLQIVGGVAILLGIVLERRWRRPAAAEAADPAGAKIAA